MNNNLQEQLLNLVPTKYHIDLVVAGGYAADPSKAEDIDLWILDVQPEEFDEVEHEVRSHLNALGSLGEIQHPRTWSPNISAVDPNYDEHVGHFRVVALQSAQLNAGLRGFRVIPVQIIITKQEALFDLVNVFDISTHMVGYYVTNRVAARSKHWTCTSEQPRVVSFARPNQTLPRIEKIAKRYGFTPLAEDIRQLEDVAAALNTGWLEVA